MNASLLGEKRRSAYVMKLERRRQETIVDYLVKIKSNDRCLQKSEAKIHKEVREPTQLTEITAEGGQQLPKVKRISPLRQVFPFAQVWPCWHS